MGSLVISFSLIIGAYVLGSISSAIVVCRLLSLPDPRTGGSGNPGATNVLRLGGKKAAAVTLVGDFSKGLLPVLIASWLEAAPWIIALTGIAALLGHLFPVFFRFQGGKGVATALGVMTATYWPLGLLLAGTWFLVAKLFKISSLAALIAAFAAPLYAIALDLDLAFSIMAAAISALVLIRHQGNIRRLLAGTETRIGQ